MSDDESNDPILDALWKHVTDHWDDEGTHAALLDHALRAKALPELAGRYRAACGDAEKAHVAKKQLDRIVLAATEMLMSMKTPAPGRVPLPITLSALGVCIVMLAWLAFALWGKR